MSILSHLLRPLAAVHFITLAALCAGTYAPAASSETVKIPLGKQGDHWQVQRPTLGSSKAQVQSIYGEPLERTGPVGDPAIYTWYYEQFKVYFEDDFVIHSVVIPSAK